MNSKKCIALSCLCLCASFVFVGCGSIRPTGLFQAATPDGTVLEIGTNRLVSEKDILRGSDTYKPWP